MPINGTAGPDVISGTAGDDVINGLAGDDTIEGGAGNDDVFGGDDDDLLISNSGGSDELYGEGGNDTLIMTVRGTPTPIVDGGDGDDLIQVTANAVTIRGGSGNDTIFYLGGTFGGAQGTIDAGDGDDRIFYSSPPNQATTVTLGAGRDTIQLDGPGVVITDFAAGAAGDVIDLSLYGPDPVGNGLFSIQQSGADTLIVQNWSGTVFARLSNVLASSLVTANVAGASPGLHIEGTGADETWIGSALADYIHAGGGNDYVRGLAGNDNLDGGSGIDTVDLSQETGGFYVNLTGLDIVVGGTRVHGHTVRSATGQDVLFGFENVIGSGGDDYMFGDSADNLFVGGGGRDQMTGGNGSDTYYVDDSGDVVIETGDGVDRIFTSISYVLSTSNSVEMLSTDNHAATTAINLTGNGLSNTLYGNAGANVLDGRGGVDLMIGWGGDDIYYVDSLADEVHEVAGGGTDSIFASVTYVLAESGHGEIEVLSTVNHSATTAINLFGNAQGQTLYGNAGNNGLNGGGGADLMIGWDGDDIYYVDSSADEVHEVAGGGADRIYTSVSYALGESAHGEIEMLSTIDHSATAAIDVTGNALGQTLYGNAGVNWLDGKGGNDVLIAWGGADTFAFTSALGAGNIDTIHSFATGSDRIALDDAVFAGLAPGSLAAGAFVLGTGAQDADDRIIYNSASGALLFDADGNGAGTAIQFATLLGSPPIVASDFLVI